VITPVGNTDSLDHFPTVEKETESDAVRTAIQFVFPVVTAFAIRDTSSTEARRAVNRAFNNLTGLN
jgi:hypothetical protein